MTIQQMDSMSFVNVCQVGWLRRSSAVMSIWDTRTHLDSHGILLISKMLRLNDPRQLLVKFDRSQKGTHVGNSTNELGKPSLSSKRSAAKG